MSVPPRCGVGTPHRPAGDSPVATPRGCRPRSLIVFVAGYRAGVPTTITLSRVPTCLPVRPRARRTRENGAWSPAPRPAASPTRRARTSSSTPRAGSSTSARPRACAAGSRTTSSAGTCSGAHPPDGAGRRPRRVDRVEQRGRGVLPRVQPHQAAPAALQHPAEGRQVVPVPRGHARRGVAAGDGAARPEAQGRALLRSVRARVRDPRDARPPAAHVPDPDVHQGQVRPAPPARPAVPLRAHREVRGAVRRRDRPRGVRRPRRGAARLPRRRARRRC